MRKNRYKVGDYVTIRDDLEVGEYYGGFLLNNSMGQLRGKSVKIISNVGAGYQVEGCRIYTFTEEMFATKDIYHLSPGDILIDSAGYEREVFAVLGDIVAVHDGVHDGHYDLGWEHVKYLEKSGWHLRDEPAPSDVTELSVADIEAKLDLPSGSLRVKKD